jgi:hypothetical protein
MNAQKKPFRVNEMLFAAGGVRRGLRGFSFLGALLAGMAPAALVACSDTPASESSTQAPGVLQLGLGTQLDGNQYWLEATFDVAGPQTATLSSTAGETKLLRELSPGDYALKIRSDFRVLRETSGVLTLVTAKLESDATQPFSIASQSTTQVAYRFSIDGSSVELGNGELEIDFQLERQKTYLATWGGARWYRVRAHGSMTDSNILSTCRAAGLSAPCQTQSSCSFNDAQCSPVTGETSCGNPMLGLAQQLCGTDSNPAMCQALSGAFQYMGEAFSGGCGAVSGQWCVSGSGYSDADALCTSPLSGGGSSELGAATIAAPGTRSRLLYDAERHALYGVNRGNQTLERYRYEDRNWHALESLVVPRLADIALTPDRRALVVASDNGIGDIQLDQDPPVLVNRVPNPDPFCGRYPNELAMGNDGQALVVFSLRQCSGFTLTARYDSLAHTFESNPYPGGLLYEGAAASSGDGSRIYAGSNGVSPEQRITTFDPPDWTARTGTVAYNLSAVSVSDDASRVVMQNTDVLDRNLAVLGFVPAGGVALVSHDASRAFVYREDEPARLVAYALDVSPGLGAIYPEQGSFELDAPPSPAGLNAVTLTAAPDDSAVFVSALGAIRVVPVE